MADEQYQWLSRETAERLLRGEPLENVDDAARGQAGRLAGALAALSAEAAPARGELPGEEGALVAFRKAREATSEPAAVLGRGGSRTRRSGVSHQPSDAGLVLIGSGPRRASGRPRWGRPVRLALAAAVAVGTVGGVAMAAGTGILPVPFGKGHPGPAASVSVGATSDRSVPSPLVSPSGDADRDASSGPPSPSAPPSRVPPTGSGLGTPGPNPSGSGSAGGSVSGWGGAPAACRDLQNGKTLGSGRERQLETAAGGAARVPAYCKVVLASTDDAADGVSTKSDQGNNGKGDNGQGNNGQGDQGNQGDQGQGDQGLSGSDNGNGANAGHGTQRRRDGGTPLPSPSASAPTDSPTRSPSPSSSPSSSPSPSPSSSS